MASMARAGAATTLGRGIRGIGQTVSQRRQRERQQERQDRLDEERRQHRDLHTDLRLREMGGGLGEMPTVEEEIHVPEPRAEFEAPQLLDAPPEGPEVPAGVEGTLPEPDFEQRDTPTIERPAQEGLVEVGDGMGYIEDPAHRERRLAQERRDRLGPAIERTMGGEPEAEDFGVLVEEGVRFDQLLPEPEQEYDPDQDPQIAREQWRVDQGFTPTGQQVFPQDDPGAQVVEPGEGQPPPRLDVLDEEAQFIMSDVERIQERVNAGELDPESAERQIELAIQRSPFQSLGEAHQYLRRGQVGTQRQPRAAEGPFEPTLPMQHSPAVDVGRQAITQDMADYLREVEGLSDDEIQQRFIIR